MDNEIYSQLAFALSRCDLELLAKAEEESARREESPETKDGRQHLIDAIRSAVECWTLLRPKQALGEMDLKAFREQDAAQGSPACRKCGCTNNYACVDENGDTCHWAEPDLCSACADPSLIILPMG